MAEILKISGLAVGYPDASGSGETAGEVVGGIDLTVNATDYIGVIGPNGGGKTTLIKTLVGVLPPLAGRIEYPSGPIKIGYLPQVQQVDRKFPIPVREVVLSGLMAERGVWGRYGPRDRSRAAALLEQTGIAALARRPIGELSGGELQRVLLCRALICEPQLLILDEPTTFVDARFEKELYRLLTRLNERMAILMVSHDFEAISRVVKSIVSINRSFHFHSEI